MARKTEAELLNEAQKHAEDALAQMPEPVGEYLTGSVEDDERQAAQDAKAEEQRLDQENDASDHARLDRLEHLILQQSTAIADIVKSLKPHGLVTPQGEPLERETPRGPVNGKELVKIYIAPHANENRPITGCVNGNAFSVPYGELTTVSRAVLEVLQHAVIDTWEYPIENGRYLGVRSPDQPHMTPSLPIHRKTPRFSIMVYEQEAA